MDLGECEGGKNSVRKKLHLMIYRQDSGVIGLFLLEKNLKNYDSFTNIEID
jgi:hypothetical protein